jgi:hypothetical protein
MILTILFVVDMFLWFLTLLPVQPVAPYAWAHPMLGWIAVLLLGLFLFMPALR